MSRFLLDTNIIINIANQTETRLHHRLRNALSGTNEFVASAVSIWEIAIKIGAGRTFLKISVHTVPGILAHLSVKILPMSIEHALEVAHPEPATKDPFDRLLLAVCACEGLKLLTTDTHLAGHRLVY